MEQLQEVSVPWRPAAPTPLTMLDRAIAEGKPIELLERLMSLHERWEAQQARRAFDNAIAAAKLEMEPVERNRLGHNAKKYADLAAYARALDPILAKQGLSYRWRTRQDNGAIHVTCVLSHRDGHSEENSLSGPADKTGSKNDIQAIGSTLTYLQRYTLAQAVGAAAAPDDDGKAAGLLGTISADQIERLKEETKDWTSDALAWLLKYVDAEGFDSIQLAKYGTALYAIGLKKGRDKVMAAAVAQDAPRAP